MSTLLNYNSRLKPMPFKGLCGDKEIIEESDVLQNKVSEIADLIRNSKHTVVFTGAGISTSAGIPDFRGPQGVWTRELRGDEFSTDEKTVDIFNQAKPTLTHYILTKLLKCGLIHHIISQNVDGLHLRSGTPPNNLSELHGNICIEICEKCSTRYFRQVDIGGMGLLPTGKKCEQSQCSGILRDFAIDWETPLPEDIFRQARNELHRADLVICLGTSLRIRPAGNMPLSVFAKSKYKAQPGKIVIVNLQNTHLDKKASVRIHHYCDEVMKMLSKILLNEEVSADCDTYNLVQNLVIPPDPHVTKEKKSRKRNLSDN